MKQVVKNVEVMVLNKEVERNFAEHFVVTYNDVNVMHRDAEILRKQHLDVEEHVEINDDSYIEIYGNDAPEALQESFFKTYGLYDLGDDQQKIDAIIKEVEEYNSKVGNFTATKFSIIKETVNTSSQVIDPEVLEYFMRAYNLDKVNAELVIKSHQTWEEEIIELLKENKSEDLYSKIDNTNLMTEARHWFNSLSDLEQDSIAFYAADNNLNIFDVCKVLYNEGVWFEDVIYDYKDNEGVVYDLKTKHYVEKE